MEFKWDSRLRLGSQRKKPMGYTKAFEAGLEPTSLSLILDRIIDSLLEPMAKVEFIKC
jgi:hypothetical protein